MEEQRSKAIENIFLVFHKPAKREEVQLICERTNGINTAKFFSACGKIESGEEFPKNLSAAIIRAAGHEKSDTRCCPECCVYIDGKIDMYEDGTPHYYVPGLRHYSNTETGGHYTTPCTCGAGKAIRDKAGMGPEPVQRQEREVNREWW